MDTDIATDACPSPPRQDRPDNEEEIYSGQHDNEPSKSTPTYTTKKPKGYTKRPKARCDNAIYINNSKDIHIGSTTTFTINMGRDHCQDKQETNKEESKEAISPKTRKLLNSSEPVLRSHLVYISGHIRSTNWKRIASYLLYSDGQIDQFYANYSRLSIKEVIFKFLLDWMQSEGRQATLGRLANSFWNCDEREAACVLAEHVFTDQ